MALEKRGTASDGVLPHVPRPTGAEDLRRCSRREGLPVDSASPNSTSPLQFRAGSVGPDAGISELGELILAEHARILRLFDALDRLVMRGEPAVARLALDQIWTRLASLLEVHTRAEEEVCFPLVSSSDAAVPGFAETAIADHDDLREAIQQARLLDVGSPRWWQVITATRTACTQHFASEEQGPLAQVCGSLSPGISKVLVRRWTAFAAAHATETQVSPPRGGPMRGR